MENLCSQYANYDHAPRRRYRPAAVSTTEYTETLHAIELAHQENADFLRSPNPIVEPTVFHRQAETTERLARRLSQLERQGIDPAPADLAHGQEVIFYATSRLRSALTTWIDVAKNDPTYSEQARIYWLQMLMSEVVSDLKGHLVSHE
jgi:hypothetical protein